jgi:hypothetical protein
MTIERQIEIENSNQNKNEEHEALRTTAGDSRHLVYLLLLQGTYECKYFLLLGLREVA